MANEVSGVTVVTTDPTVLDGVTYTKTVNSITGSVERVSAGTPYVILELLDGSNAVVRRKTEATAGFQNGQQVPATVAGLTAGTAYNCRMQRGDVSLADI